MKVLMLSTDSKILEKDSEAQNRMKDYAGLTDELHIIIYTASSRRYKFEQVEPNLFLYPTNNFFRLGYFFSAYNVSKRIIKDTRGWLITTQDPFETGLVGFWLKNKYNLPLQIQIHTDFLSPYFWRESLKNKVRVLIAKKILLSANNIRVVSRRIKNSLRALNWRSQVHITVLPIHTDIAKIKNSPINMDLHKKYPDYNFIILMASRLTKEKNINLAIEAMKEVVQNNQDILLLIVGDGPEHVNLKFQISSLKLQNSVIIENWSQDLASYYKTADLFLLTSNYEGYGRTAIEATGASLPVLMTDVGIAIGCVVPVGNKKELVNKLNLLIKYQTARSETLEKQQVFILNNCPDKNEYLNLIKQSWQNCFS